MNKNITINLKILLMPTLAIVVLTIITFVFAGVILDKINTVNADLDALSRSKNVLEAKLSTLTSISGESLTDTSEAASIALPEKNSALLSMAQFRSMASESSLVLENMKVGSEIKDSTTSHVDVTFDVEGPTEGVISYLKSVATIAPINKISKFKISSSGGNIRASVTSSSYWSGFPKTIPAVESPFEPFTADEQKLIDHIASLRKPQFVTLTPEGDSGRVDPFSL